MATYTLSQLLASPELSADFDPFRDRLDLQALAPLVTVQFAADATLFSTAAGSVELPVHAAVLVNGQGDADNIVVGGGFLAFGDNRVTDTDDKLGNHLTAHPSQGSQLHGLAGDDTLSGGAGNDRLYGGNDNDRLTGGGGNDFLNGGAGHDWINGGTGNDIVVGLAGNDTLIGGPGHDLIRGGAHGRGVLAGGPGNDTLYGGADASDRMLGGRGDDLIVGKGLGAGYLSGNQGDDTLRGGRDHDRLLGGTGDDLLIGDRGHDTLHGMSGIDTLWGQWGDDLLSGGSRRDILRGGPGDDLLLGGPGHDVLGGSVGNDRLIGGGGNDRLAGNQGSDIMRGDAGNDIFDMVSRAVTDVDVIVDFQPGDSVRLTSATYARDQLSQQGSDVRLDFPGGGVLLFNNADLETIHQALLPYADQSDPGGPEFQVNTQEVDQQRDPSVAPLTNGGFVVTWTDGGYGTNGLDGSYSGVFGQRFDALGNRIGDDFLVNTQTTGHQSDASVTPLADGGFVVAWHAAGQQHGNSFRIFAQRFDADGKEIGGEFQVNSFIDGNQWTPEAAGLTNGGFVVTWVSTAQDGSGYGVYGQRYGLDGTALGGEFQIHTLTEYHQEGPTVAGLTGGGFVVAWQSAGQDGTGNGYGIIGQRYDANGGRLGGEFQANEFAANHQYEPSLAALQDGGFVIAWTSEGQDGSGTGVYGRRYDANGASVGPEFRINSQIDLDQTEPSVVGLSDGGFLVSWTSMGQDGDGSGIFAKRFGADGAPTGEEFQINTYTQDMQAAAAVAPMADGHYAAFWQSMGQDAEGDGIYGRLFTPAQPALSHVTPGNDTRGDAAQGDDIRPDADLWPV